MHKDNTIKDDNITLGSPERFGYEWKLYSDIFPESRTQLARWLGSATLESFEGKTVLDAGCGMARNSYWILKAGAKAVTSVDIDENSLNSARKNLSPFKNSTIKKISIYDLRASTVGTFDRVICIGVLHHLSSPKEALKSLWDCVTPGGELILWCYGKTGNQIVLPMIEACRFIGSRLPIRYTHFLSKIIAFTSYPLFQAVPWKTEYYRYIKSLSYKNFESIVFDQILPRIAHYWTKEDIEGLINPLRGQANIEFVQENSWTIRVKK